jgi:uncharacterized membrane protein
MASRNAESNVRQQMHDHPAKEKNDHRFIGIGLAMGINVGAVLGVVFDNIGAGIAIGICTGIVIGVVIDTNQKKFS